MYTVDASVWANSGFLMFCVVDRHRAQLAPDSPVAGGEFIRRRRPAVAGNLRLLHSWEGTANLG